MPSSFTLFPSAFLPSPSLPLPSSRRTSRYLPSCALENRRPFAPILSLISTLFPSPTPISLPPPDPPDDDGLSARLHLRPPPDDDGLSARLKSRPRKRLRKSQQTAPVSFGIPEERVYEFIAEAVRRKHALHIDGSLEILLPYDLQKALFDELRTKRQAKVTIEDRQKEEQKEESDSLWTWPVRFVAGVVKGVVGGKADGKVKADAAVYAALANDMASSQDQGSAAAAFAAAAAIASRAEVEMLEPAELAVLKQAVASGREIATIDDAIQFVEGGGVAALATAARLLRGGEGSAALTALANVAIILPRSRVRMLKVEGMVDMLKDIVIRRERFKVGEAVAGESASWQTEALVSGTYLLGSLALTRGSVGKEARLAIRKDAELLRGLTRLAGGLKNGEPEGAARAARRALGALGVNQWKPRMPGQKGLRILSIDGGGTRAIMTFEALKQLKKATGCEIHELFDIIGGTSTGGIVAASIGIARKTVEEVELLYRDMIGKIFAKYPTNGPKMLLTRAYYDTGVLETILKAECGKGVFLDSLAEENMNRVFVVSSIMSRDPKELHLFRNYTYPPGHESRYIGSVEAQLWEGLRASSAAPTFFTEIRVNGELHADGAIVANNPTAVAIHETKCMYPGVPIELVVSLGNGVYPGKVLTGDEEVVEKKMGWGDVVGSIVASATSTEVVHHAMQDLFPEEKYFRFNPITDSTQIDETDENTLASFVKEAQDYIRANQKDFDHVARILRPKTPRSLWRRFSDAITKELQFLEKSAKDDEFYLPY